jgi:hypothetical protein
MCLKRNLKIICCVTFFILFKNFLTTVDMDCLLINNVIDELFICPKYIFFICCTLNVLLYDSDESLCRC